MGARGYAKEFAMTAGVSLLDLGTDVGALDDIYVTSATIVNSNTVTTNATLNLASDGSANSAANYIEYNLSCSPNKSTNTCLSGKLIKHGGKLYAGASTGTGMTLQISGQIVPST